jgi:Tfp pilus assembly protein PilX
VKTYPSGANVRQQGGALLVTLVIAAVVSLTLSAYLTWANLHSKLAARSESWNAALPVAEAGVEEALTQLHETGVTNLSANGWTTASNGWYHKKNYVDSQNFYDVSIKPTHPPVIVSTGYVPAPISSGHVKRRVRVTTTGGPVTGAAVISKGPISLSGNGVTIDSFDSTDPAASTDGKWDPLKAGDGADVITLARDGLTANGKPIYALDVGDADIKGHVTAPSGSTINVTAGGSVGSSSWVNTGTAGIEPGWSSTDASVGIDDVQEPFSGGYYTPGPTTVGKVKYQYYLNQSANYKLSTLSGKTLVTANAVLWVTDDVNIGTGEFIQIADGASLKLYVSAPSAVIGGQGVVNESGLAKNFTYYGLPTNTSIDYKGNSAFYGTINAPQAAVKLGGGGTTDYDFNGSLIVDRLTMNGHYHIHYDESLGTVVPLPLVVSSWNEVDPNAAVQ